MPSASHAGPDLFGGNDLPEGFRYKDNLITKTEEQELVAKIEGLAFKAFEFHGFTGNRRVVSFGWRYDFNGGGLTKTDDMPELEYGIKPLPLRHCRRTRSSRSLLQNTRPVQPSAGTKTDPCLEMLSAFRCSLPAPSGSAAKLASAGIAAS